MSGGRQGRGRRWGTNEAREVLAQWRRSGQSASAFARARGFSAMRLSYWAKRLASESAVRFVPITVEERTPKPEGVIEIEHAGVKLVVAERLGAEQIAQLCAALVRAVRAC